MIKPKICRRGPTGVWAGYAPGRPNLKIFSDLVAYLKLLVMLMRSISEVHTILKR